MLEKTAGARRLRLVVDGLGRNDVTGAIAPNNVIADARGAGLDVELSGVPPQARAVLERCARHRSALR